MAIKGTWGAPDIAGIGGPFPTRNPQRIAYCRRHRFVWIWKSMYDKTGDAGIVRRVIKFRRYCKRMERAK